ncbi:MAG: glycosyltransferase family 4 protein [Anaerolineae bacterium]|nr:glycosyltransferase family 4 protein [Anaerolineae bacterium]
MRILYFTRDYTPHDHRFLSAMVAAGLQVYCLRLERRGNQMEDRPLPAGVEQIRWRGGQRPARLVDAPFLLHQLQRIIRQVRPDILHAGPVQTCAFLAALSGFRPLVTLSWGSDLLRDADRNVWWRLATRLTLMRTTVLLGDCQAVSRRAQQMGYPAEQIVLFPWGVDLTHFSPGSGAEFRQRIGWQDSFVLLSLRAWEPLYGVDLLVTAFARAAQKEDRLRLFLLGSGSQAGLLRQILMQYGVLDRVYFGGQVSYKDLPRYYRAADLYVSASHSDGSSVSLMEALACGCPVLVSDIPGNREWIVPGGQGWIFADGDVEALEEYMLDALRQPEALRRMAQRARALAEQRADWSKNFQQLLRGYQLALQTGR